MIVNPRREGRCFLPILGSALLLACAACGRHSDVQSSGVALHYLAGCAPPAIERVRLEALGDFPLALQGVRQVTLSTEDLATTIAALPLDTAWYRLSVEQAGYRGYALFPALAEGGRADAFVLPLGQACALPTFTPSSAALAFAGDTLVGAGLAEADGTSGSRALTRFTLESGTLTRSPAALFVPRIAPTALGVGDEAWFIGGAAESRAGTRALDTFERYAGSAVDGLGRLAVGRVAPVAQVLGDGSVLIAGGSDRVGNEQLASLERVVAGRDAELLESALPERPDQLALRARDDGVVWLATLRAGALRVFELDVALDALDERAPPALAPGVTLDLAHSVALPGGRVASLELADGVTSGVVWIALPDGAYVAVADFLPSLRGFVPLASAPLRDGRWLLSGTRDGLAEARIVDVGRRSVAQHTLPTPADTLLVRADGSVFGAGAEGAWVLREDTLTRYENLGGTLLADDVEVLALDAAGRFERVGLALVASEDDARFDLAPLTFEDVRITLRTRGDSELVLTRADGRGRSIALSDTHAGPALCELARSADDVLEITRHADDLTLSSAGETLRCRLDGMTGPLRVAMRFRAGSRVDELQLGRE